MYDPATYFDPTDPANFDDTFTYKNKEYQVADIESITWEGEQTLDGMEAATIWVVKMAGKKAAKWKVASIDELGVYFMKEIAFPG